MRHCVVTALLVLIGGCKGGSEVDCSLVDFTVIPSARGEVRGVWDTDRQRMVFFGGDQGVPQNCFPQTDFVGQTWAFHTDCDNFELLAEGAAGPPARSRYAAGHDATRERMIVHGGRWRSGTSGRTDTTSRRSGARGRCEGSPSAAEIWTLPSGHSKRPTSRARRCTRVRWIQRDGSLSTGSASAPRISNPANASGGVKGGVSGDPLSFCEENRHQNQQMKMR